MTGEMMPHAYHHSLSSVKKWGGTVEDYARIHDFFDESKRLIADFRHRALRHHAEGIFVAGTIFGRTITLSSGRVVPTRLIGEQHVREDLGFIPSFADWVDCQTAPSNIDAAIAQKCCLNVRHQGSSWRHYTADLQC